MGKQQTIPLPKVTQRKWWCGGNHQETFSHLVFFGGGGHSHYHLPSQGAANPAEKSLLVFHTECSQPPWEAGRGPAASPAQLGGHKNPPMSLCQGGRGGKECGLRWRRGLRVWLCSLFLAMLLIRSGTLGDSFNLSLSQIQTSTSSYYNIWLHYGIVERLN